MRVREVGSVRMRLGRAGWCSPFRNFFMRNGKGGVLNVGNSLSWYMFWGRGRPKKKWIMKLEIKRMLMWTTYTTCWIKTITA